MENIKTEIKGNRLIILVDLSTEGHPSASGKSKVLATTSGFAESGVPGIRFGLNVIKKA